MAGQYPMHPLGEQPHEVGSAVGGEQPRPVEPPLPAPGFPAATPSASEYAVCWLDLNGRVTRWSPACETLFGREASEVLGSHFRELFTVEDRDRGHPELILAAARESGSWDGVGWRTAPALGRFWSASSATLVRTPNEVEVGYMVVTRDLTSLASELSGVVSADAARLTSVGRIATDVAHDVGNILAAIRGFAGLLERYLPKSGASHQVWYELLKACDRGTDLTARLLGVGRSPEEEARSVDVVRVVREVEPLLRQVLPSRILMVVSLEDDLPLAAVRASDLELALLNLVVNARDAIEDEGTIAITVAGGEPGGEVEEERIVLSVRDSGRGMPAEVRKRAFERFFTTKNGEGSGVGLALVQDAVRSSGGWVDIDSKLGLGTTIRIVFHAARDRVPEDDASVEPPAHQEAHGGLGRVLVCCRCGVLGDCVVDMLKRSGFEVVDAEDVATARSIYDEVGGDFDLVLMDLSLSDAVGPALMTELRGGSDSPPAIYFASRSGVGDEVSSIADGDRLLSEPFSPSELLSAVLGQAEDGDELAVRSVH